MLFILITNPKLYINKVEVCSRYNVNILAINIIKYGYIYLIKLNIIKIFSIIGNIV